MYDINAPLPPYTHLFDLYFWCVDVFVIVFYHLKVMDLNIMLYVNCELTEHVCCLMIKINIIIIWWLINYLIHFYVRLFQTIEYEDRELNIGNCFAFCDYEILMWKFIIHFCNVSDLTFILDNAMSTWFIFIWENCLMKKKNCSLLDVNQKLICFYFIVKVYFYCTIFWWEWCCE